MWTITGLRLRRNRRGASNIIVVVLSLVIIVAIVSNIVLWSYELNQLDWEKMKEDMSITNVERINRSSWFVAQNEYTVKIGSRINGNYTDTQAVDGQYESFRETSYWWNASYGYRGQITITNNIASTLSSGYSVLLTIDTESLVSLGKMLSNGNDLRIICWNGSSWIELDRDIIDMNTDSTQVWFKTQANISASGSNNDYYIYYGNPSAANPPANKSNVYDFWDDFDNASLDPAWTFSQIGGASGSYSESGTVVILNATNSGNLSGTSDNFLFLSISRSYDVLVESYTSGWGGSHQTWSKMGGVQLRQSLDANSTNRIMSPVYSAVGATNSYRLSAGGNTSEQTTGTQPRYNRLSRIGGTSRAWYSTDGVSWTELGSQISFSDELSDPVRLGIHLAGSSSSSHWVEVDWFKVRKYIDPEPSTSVGLEEQNTGFKMEWGFVTVDDTFTTVNLANTYISPVIVCVPSYTSGVPRSVRIRNALSTSFEVRVQNPSGTASPSTTVYYIVVEEGVWTSPIKLEAQKYDTKTVGRDNNWAYDTRNYGQTYSGNLVVFHQVMTYDDNRWITTYVSRATSRTDPPSSADSSFRIALNGAEAVNSHQTETIAYIIVEQGYGTLGGVKYDVKRTTDSVAGFDNSPPYNTAFSQSFSSVPAVLVSSQLEMDGPNGGWVVDHTITQTQAGLMIDEDQVRDAERSHTTETCGFWAFENVGTVSALSRLSTEGTFAIDVSTYPLDSIQTMEIQLRYRAYDSGEKWYLKAYNWSSLTYSDSGFNSTAGHTPTMGWDYYAVNLTDKWRSYVNNDGMIYVKFVDETADSGQTTVDIDFLGVRAKIDGTRFTFKNEGALTSHMVSLWVINSTNHQRYDINVFVNSAETTTYILVDVGLFASQCTVKVVTERGNIAVYSVG